MWGLRLDISSNFPSEGDAAASGLGTPLERHCLNPSVWWSFSGRRGRGDEPGPLLLCSSCSPLDSLTQNRAGREEELMPG